MLLFLDLETTGLDAAHNIVLEVAAILVRDDFSEVARFGRVIGWAPAARFSTGDCRYYDIDPVVIAMHTTNGLWAASARSPHKCVTVDADLAAFVRTHCGADVGEKQGPQLAGNTINFDRAFLKRLFPETHALLHYRNLDVTTLNEMSKRFWPEVHLARPRAANAAHRAMADCLESLECARYYARVLGPVATPRLTVGEIYALNRVEVADDSVLDAIDGLIARAVVGTPESV